MNTFCLEIYTPCGKFVKVWTSVFCRILVVVTRAQKFSLVLLLVFAVALAAVVQNYLTMTTSNSLQKNFRTVALGSTVVHAEVVDTDVLREKGLSGRTGLPQGEGMLFVFDHADTWGFWMKDMLFPIDMIWVGPQDIVVTIKSDVAPDSYPQSFYPTSPAIYVLEVPAGFAVQHGIADGTKVVVQ
jgi:uncharacterized membrane protein (UPF0127 family)